MSAVGLVLFVLFIVIFMWICNIFDDWRDK